MDQNQAKWPPPKQIVLETVAAPVRSANGMGYTDMGALHTWEATLSGKQAKVWEELCYLIENSDAETRTAVISLCLSMDLNEGRTAYQKAFGAGEKFKAKLISANGKQLSEKIAWLNQSVRFALEATETSKALASWAREKTQTALDHSRVLETVRLQFFKVQDAWVGSPDGLESGKGITGFDTPENVEKLRKAAEERLAQKRAAAQAQITQKLAEVQPVVDAKIEEEKQLAALRKKAEAEETKKKTPEPPIGGLFGQR